VEHLLPNAEALAPRRHSGRLQHPDQSPVSAELPLIYADIVAAGCRAWQLALTVPMGRAADRPELLLQPPELLDLFSLLNELAIRAARDGLLLFPGNNIGYYGPYERRLRGGPGSSATWEGCQAGGQHVGDRSRRRHKRAPVAADIGVHGRYYPATVASADTGGDARVELQCGTGIGGSGASSLGLLRDVRVC